MNLDAFMALMTEAERARFDACAKAGDVKMAPKLLVEVLGRLGENRSLMGRLMPEFRARYLTTASKERLPVERWAHELPYPLGLKLKVLLSDAERLKRGEHLPQFPYELCAVTGLAIRFLAVTAIRAYVEGGASEQVLNSELLKMLKTPSDGAWLSISQRLSSWAKKRIKSDGEEAAQALDASGWLRRIDACLNDRAGGQKTSGQLMDLVAFRNRLIHGETMRTEQIRSALKHLKGAVGTFREMTEWELLVRSEEDEHVYRLMGNLPERIEAPSDTLKELPEDEPCLVHRKGKHPHLSLSPLLSFKRGVEVGEMELDDLFFLNNGSTERSSYVAFRVPQHLDGRKLGTYEAFRSFMDAIPVPPPQPEPRIKFDELAAFHSRLFVGRVELLEELDRFVRERPAPYGVVKAFAGMGKTAVFTRLYERHHQYRPIPSGDRWIFHYCMATAGRNSPYIALRSMIAQLCDAFELPRQNWLKTDIKELKDQYFPLLLGQVSGLLKEGERVVLVVDALDEGIGVEEESVPSVLPAHLPDGVVGLISYRVNDEEHNPRVEQAIAHIPAERLQTLEHANPLRGLNRDNVESYLARASGRESVPEISVDAVWEASSSELRDSADPFFLRLFNEELEAGRIDIERPETFPASLEEAFDELWLSLPTEHDFLIHRLLGYLAVMREYGDDELFAELFNRQRNKELAPLHSSDIARLRVKAGKLLVFDGEKYGLFHDRFRRFLVGEQPDPLEMTQEEHRGEV